MIHGSGGTALRSAVIGLAAGTSLDRHGRPGEAVLQVLTGQVRVTQGLRSWHLGSGDYLALPQSEHVLLALEDTAVLLTVDVGGPSPQVASGTP